MTRIKVTYDFSRIHWNAYGRVAIVDVAPGEDQVEAALRAIHEIEGKDVCVDALAIRPATDEEHQRWLDFKARTARWMANTASGAPNQRGDL